MELKCAFLYVLLSISQLLIVPYGIEINVHLRVA